MQPAAPSTPGSRNVNVTVMFGAAANVIKSGTSSEPVASGGFVILSIPPIVPSKVAKPPCCEEAGLFMENWPPANAMLPRDISTVPVTFRTPVIVLADAAKGRPSMASKANAKIVFFIFNRPINSLSAETPGMVTQAISIATVFGRVTRLAREHGAAP